MARKSRRKTAMMSIFGRVEALVAEQMIAEGKATRISRRDTEAAGAATEDERGRPMILALAVPGPNVTEWEERLRARREAHGRENTIQLYFHCARCFNDRPEDTSPRDWAKLECGWTPVGFQVWCKRCDINVAHVDFEGLRHPAVS